MHDDWCSAASPTDLETVAQALEGGRLSFAQGASAAAQSLGVADPQALRRFLSTSPAHDPAALAWGLRRLAAERRAAHDRFARSAQLVWSGQHEGSQPLRDTRAVLNEVCARATERLLLATYAIHNGLESLSALSARMRAVPALQVDLYVHVKGPRHRPPDEARDVAAWLTQFRAAHWPGDVRLPAVWYDPATLDPEGGTSMHAKCVVVDDRWAFVTSANFTEAAQERNIEVGVVLDHPVLARALTAQFQGLQARGRFRRVPGT
jgi:hypothetical protein